MFSNGWRGVTERDKQIVRLQRMQPVQQPQRMQSRLQSLAAPQQLAQRNDRCRIVALIDQPMGRIAPN